jgi:preprotein translocase subunit SecG
MYTFLLVVHALVAIALVGVILMQRSEGGGLAGGGNPSGLMSARGAADFLTRTTTILAGAFVLLSIALAAIASINRAPAELDTSLASPPVAPMPANPALPLPGAPDQAGGLPIQTAPAPAAIPMGAAPQPRVTDTPARTRDPQVQPRRDAAPKAEAAAPKAMVTPPPVVTTPPATGNSSTTQ